MCVQDYFINDLQAVQNLVQNIKKLFWLFKKRKLLDKQLIQNIMK